MSSTYGAADTPPPPDPRHLVTAVFKSRLRGQEVEVELAALVGGCKPPNVVSLAFLSEQKFHPLTRHELDFLAREGARQHKLGQEGKS